jgi:hypothetical protein
MPDTRPQRPRRWYQFGLAAILLTTSLVAVLMSALAGLLRGDAGRMPPGFFIVMAIAAPMAVMIFLSLLRAVTDRRKRGRR